MGGAGLHVAHVLWGGLLMALALVLLLSFVGPVVRPLACVVAGVGFGLFIDEVGKFVTSDNDYFYRPAPAIMYVVLVVLTLLAHLVHSRPLHPAEHLAGAVDAAVAGVAGGFTAEKRAAARRRLARADDSPGAAQVAALLDAVPDDPEEFVDPLRVIRRGWRLVVAKVAATRATPVVAVCFLIAESTHAAQSFGLDLYAALLPGSSPGGDRPNAWASALGTGSAALAMVLVIVGLARLRGDRRAAFTSFQYSLLVTLLVTRVFQFDVDQFLTALFVTGDLVLLGVVTSERARLRRLDAPAPAATASR